MFKYAKQKFAILKLKARDMMEIANLDSKSERNTEARVIKSKSF